MVRMKQPAAGLPCGHKLGLYTHAIDHLRDWGYPEAILWVIAENGRARSFYERGRLAARRGRPARPQPGLALRCRRSGTESGSATVAVRLCPDEIWPSRSHRVAGAIATLWSTSRLSVSESGS